MCIPIIPHYPFRVANLNWSFVSSFSSAENGVQRDNLDLRLDSVYWINIWFDNLKIQVSGPAI
jgi:hypothetical protein